MAKSTSKRGVKKAVEVKQAPAQAEEVEVKTPVEIGKETVARNLAAEREAEKEA